MKAYLPSWFEKPLSVDPVIAQAKDRALRIPVYSARAQAGQPLFEETVSVPVKIVQRKRRRIA